MDRHIARAVAPLQRALANMAARASIVLANSAGRVQRLQVRLLSGEAKSDLDHAEPYGFTACPHPGAEAVALFFGADRSHGVAVVVGDRRYRLQGLAAGEVALYDDLGQKVHLTRAGIVINGGGLPITVTNTPKVRMETDLLEVTGEIKDLCDTDGITMEAMRTVFNGHTHPGDSGGTTGDPNQDM